MELIIREENKIDIQFISELINHCFINEDEKTLVDLLRKRENFTQQLSIVAEDDRKIVGYLLLNPIELKTEKYLIRTVWLEPLCINPLMRRKGIGTKLVTYGITIAKKLGFESIFVTGDLAFYSRFGFCKGEKYGIKPSISIRPDAFLVLELKEKSLPNKGQLIYPEEIFG